MVHNLGISLCWGKEWSRPGFLLYRKFLWISQYKNDKMRTRARGIRH